MVMGMAGTRGPTVFDSHERVLRASPQAVGALLDRLGSADDELWPAQHWPRLELDRALELGARGGHGPFRYHVVEYEPGRLVRFRFTAPPGYVGHHEFFVEPAADQGPGAVRLRHVITLSFATLNARLTWPLVWRPLHDALIEELLDRAEATLAGREPAAREWSRYVKLLRALLRIGPR